MNIRLHLGIALTLCALGLAPGAAHLMEMPVKLAYTPALYTQVSSTLYAWFGLCGGIVQMGAVLAVALLAWRVRRTPMAGPLLAAASSLGVSLLLWGALVASVNSAWAAVLGAPAADITAAYVQLRPRWEYGQVSAFIAWCTGWVGLVVAACGQVTPPGCRVEPGAAARTRPRA